MLITEEQARRYTAFWDRTPTDRACLYLSSWDGAAGFAQPETPIQKWEDLDYREALDVYCIRHTRYHAEGFPSVFTNFGPGCLSAMIGGSFKSAPDTVWFETMPHFIEDFDAPPMPVLRRESPMYRLVEDYSERLLSHGDLFYTSVCDIGGTFDIIASLRGTENLLYDLYDYPDEVKAFRDRLEPLWKDYFLEQTRRLFERQGCMTSWMPIWSDKAYYTLQCDFCAMLSPQMFGAFILPDLRVQTEMMPRSVYHLDGPGELPHLDQLLSLPRLNAIQWVSGAGNPPSDDPCWFDTIKRIQAAGKGVILLGVRIEALETLLKNVSQTGLYITCGVRDEKEAAEIEEMAIKLNRDNK